MSNKIKNLAYILKISLWIFSKSIARITRIRTLPVIILIYTIGFAIGNIIEYGIMPDFQLLLITNFQLCIVIWSLSIGYLISIIYRVYKKLSNPIRLLKYWKSL